jgi:hypothetical protein
MTTAAEMKARFGYGGGGQPLFDAESLDTLIAMVATPALIGRLGVGLITFAAQADCTAVRIGTVVYPYDATPDLTLGEWGPHGASAANSAIALAAGINGDTRNAGGPFYKAVVGTAGTVRVFQLTPSSATVTIARVGGAQPATVEGLTGGLDEAVKKIAVIQHTVTAEEGTEVDARIALPFVPTAWSVSVRKSTGAPSYITDLVTLETSPVEHIKIVTTGATHIAATDVIVVIAQS